MLRVYELLLLVLIINECVLVLMPTDSSNDPKLDYVQDIIEVYLNTEMQGVFSHSFNNE